MIIKGGAAGSVGFWSQHLQRQKENDANPNVNDRVTVREISGLLSNTVEGALREMQAVASGSRSEGNFMYQANINPRDHERLTPEQFKKAVDTLEKQLGLEGHQRIVVEHEKKGRVHQHVIWNRVDVDTLRVKDIGGNYAAHELAAEKLEREFGLERSPKPHLDLAAYQERRDRGKPFDISEIRASQKTGIDPQQIKAELTDLWRKVDSGKAFTAAIEERGYILAQGDRRNFCIIDHAGTAHSLARRIEGAKAKDINERLADIDRDKLPTVDAARDAQREKYPTSAQAQEAWRARVGGADHARQQEQQQAKPEAQRDTKPNNQTISDIRKAWEQSPNGAGFVAAMHDQGYRVARVTLDEARQSERDAAFAKEVGNFAPRYQAGEIVILNERGRVYRLDGKTTGADLEAIGKFNVEMQSGDLPGIGDAKQAAVAEREKQSAIHKETRWFNRDQTKMEQRINRIETDAEKKGKSFAAELYAEGITLARVDAKGKADMDAEYNRRFQNDILAGKKDARLRHAPDEGELVALNKWGDVDRLNPRFMDIEKLERAATSGSDKTPTLSAAQEHFVTARQQQKDERAGAREAKQTFRTEERGYDRTAKAFKAAPAQAANKFVEAGFKGLDSAGKIASLGSFLESLLGMKAKPSPMSAEQQQQRAVEALEEIADSIERGDRLNPSDVANLLPIQLENLKRHGDAFMQEMISDLDRYRERDRDRDRGRERERER